MRKVVKKMTTFLLVMVFLSSGFWGLVGCESNRLPNSIRVGFYGGPHRMDGMVLAFESDIVIFEKDSVFLDVSFGHWQTNNLFRSIASFERYVPLYIGLYVGTAIGGNNLPNNPWTDWQLLYKLTEYEFRSEKFSVSSHGVGCFGMRRELIFNHTQRLQIPSDLFGVYRKSFPSNPCSYDCFALTGRFALALLFVVQCVESGEKIVYNGESHYSAFKILENEYEGKIRLFGYYSIWRVIQPC